MKTVFAYQSYLDYLQDQMAAAKESGISLRALAKRCGLTNPNHFNLVLRGERKLTVESAGKIAKGLGLKPKEERFFLDLVRLERAEGEKKELVAIQLKTQAFASTGKATADQSLHSHWLHGTLYEMAAIPGTVFSPEEITKKIRSRITPEEIENSLKFLVQKGYILPTDNAQHYEQVAIDFLPKEDVRQLDVRREHEFFLELARHRLNDDVNEREVRGLTFSAPMARVPEIKDRLRKLTRELSQEMMTAENKDVVLRLQVMLFKVTDV